MQICKCGNDENQFDFDSCFVCGKERCYECIESEGWAWEDEGMDNDVPVCPRCKATR